MTTTPGQESRAVIGERVAAVQAKDAADMIAAPFGQGRPSRF